MLKQKQALPCSQRVAQQQCGLTYLLLKVIVLGSLVSPLRLSWKDAACTAVKTCPRKSGQSDTARPVANL
jgi:hypothetical protein